MNDGSNPFKMALFFCLALAKLQAKRYMTKASNVLVGKMHQSLKNNQ